MKKAIYKPPVVSITRVTIEQNIAQVVVSGKVALDPWIEDPVPVGEDPASDGGDFYIFY